MGANGATVDGGVSIIDTNEKYGKLAVIKHSKQVYFVFDDSKCGIQLEVKLADFTDEKAKFIISENPDNPKLSQILEKHSDKIELARGIS